MRNFIKDYREGIVGLLVLLFVIFLAYFLIRENKTPDPLPPQQEETVLPEDEFTEEDFTGEEAVFGTDNPLGSLAPSKSMLMFSGTTVAVGDTIKVPVILHTKEQEIDGVDVWIQVPPQFEIVSIDTSRKMGMDVVPASKIMPGNVVIFSRIMSEGKTYKGKDVIGVLTLKALNAGRAKVEFQFTKGDTTDTNVAGRKTVNGTVQAGYDLLTAVTNITYYIY